MRPKEESQVEQRKIYEDIALRTEDIYIGVNRASADRKIDLYQTLHGDHGHPQYRQRVPPGAGPG